MLAQGSRQSDRYHDLAARVTDVFDIPPLVLRFVAADRQVW